MVEIAHEKGSPYPPVLVHLQYINAIDLCNSDYETPPKRSSPQKPSTSTKNKKNKTRDEDDSSVSDSSDSDTSSDGGVNPFHKSKPTTPRLT
ncbi:hypothetical protein TrLO_g12572 [Triparma laevis f. longispina]|uniref:Uncharacterized protein n=1 Tax=Triparma laevis f. longispina TaxID=1714387 RepID=A0A9W6ZUI9_9STRA|nr:hypothetical protein TrLO_g12572 [Triparma laevis f. longispina]